MTKMSGNSEKQKSEPLCSTDTMDPDDWSFASFSQRVMDAAVKAGIEKGVEVALARLEQGDREQRKGRYKRRLHNTRTLLQNYRPLKQHVRGAVYSSARAQESAVEILEGLEGFRYTSNLFIDSIRQSEERTLIILTHIDEMLKFYRVMCKDGGPDALRTYRVLMARYINEPKKTATEIIAEFSISDRTMYNDLKRGTNDLSALLFGVDGLRMDR